MQVYNIASGKETSVNQLIKIIEKITKKKPIIHKQPPKPTEIRHSLADITLAEKHLDFKPKTSLEQGVAKVYHWIKQGEKPIL